MHLEYPVDLKPRYSPEHPHEALQQIINANREDYERYLHLALKYQNNFFEIPVYRPPGEESCVPYWINGFLPGLDIIMLYTILASENPATYIEIGSGNSTMVAAKAREDHQLRTKIISIDPAPRTEIDQLSDVMIRQPFETADVSVFRTLKSGDIVFVDNSHRVLPNSDATAFFMDVLPYLAPGVLVHIHDVYLPYDYPQNMCDRYYSEQYALAAFVLANPTKYKTIMPNFFVSEDAQLNQILKPVWDHPMMANVERHGGSYWLQIGE
jgi:predicted O-methyltransferase YrrM